MCEETRKRAIDGEKEKNEANKRVKKRGRMVSRAVLSRGDKNIIFNRQGSSQIVAGPTTVILWSSILLRAD